MNTLYVSLKSTYKNYYIVFNFQDYYYKILYSVKNHLVTMYSVSSIQMTKSDLIYSTVNYNSFKLLSYHNTYNAQDITNE